MAFTAYNAGNYQAATSYLLAASGVNMESLQIATGWDERRLLEFGLYFTEHANVEYLRQLPFNEQLITVYQVFTQYLHSNGINMDSGNIMTSVIALTAAINGELRMADAQTMDNLYKADNIQEIFAAATFLNFAEREAADNFLTGPPQPMALASPAEQYAVMLEAYFEEIKEMGWRRTKEEKDAEEHAKEMQHLSSEAEEIKQKFVAELKAMNPPDVAGLAALADGYEGDGMSQEEWRAFWTPERAEAFRRAIRNA